MTDPSLADPLLWRTVAKAIVLPPASPLIIAIAGFVLMRRRPRAGRALAVAGVAILTLLAMPAVGTLLLHSIYASPPFEPSNVDGARAIVILGGGVRRNAPEYGGDTLSVLTLERVRYGARVAKQTSLPVLVTGGVGVSGGSSEASLMRAALEQEFGVPVRWAEDRSRNTHENAQMSAALLKDAGIDKVLLVAHSFDMPRARAEFAAAGIETIPAPTLVPRRTETPATLLDVLPSVGGLAESYFALYEILAEALRRVTALIR